MLGYGRIRGSKFGLSWALSGGNRLGLSNACPHTGAVRSVVASRGQASNKPKRYRMAVMVRFVDACSSKSSWSPRRPCLADRGRIGSGPAAHVEHARRIHSNSSPVPCAKGTVQMVFPGALKPRGGLTGFYVPLRPKPLIFEMSGGNDGLNTVVPYTDDAYYRARP